MDEPEELSKDARDKLVGMHMAGMGEQLGERETTPSDWGSMQRRAGTTVSGVVTRNTLCQRWIKNLVVHVRYPCSSQHMSWPGWGLPGRSHGRSSGGQMRPHFYFFRFLSVTVEMHYDESHRLLHSFVSGENFATLTVYQIPFLHFFVNLYAYFLLQIRLL